MRVLLALALPGALALVPPPAPSTTRTTLQSWQPNTNFNGEQENRLTDFERAARDEAQELRIHRPTQRDLVRIGAVDPRNPQAILT